MDGERNLTTYLNIAASFTAMKLIAFTPRHIISYLTVNIQNEQNSSVYTTFKNTIKNNGISGLLNGYSIGITRIFVSETYRGLLMLDGPSFVKQSLDKYLGTNLGPVETSLISSMTLLPLVDATIMNPLIRISNIKILQENQNKTTREIVKSYILSKGFKEGFRSCYSGFTMTYIISSANWASFMVVDRAIKEHIKAKYGSIDYNRLALYNILGACIQTGILQPFDIIRLHMQKSSKDIGIIGASRDIYNQYGCKGFFRGYTMKLFGVHGFNYFYRSILLQYFTDKSNDKSRSR